MHVIGMNEKNLGRGGTLKCQPPNTINLTNSCNDIIVVHTFFNSSCFN